MALTKIDRIDTLEAVERYGAIVRLVRRARVVELASTDYSVLFSSLAAVGIPAAGSKLTGSSVGNLVLTERNPKLVDETTVDVDLVYEHVLNDGQSMDTPPFGLLVGEVQATINQTDSNKDIDGKQVVLTHTYPADDPDYGAKAPATVGQTKTQGVTFQYYQPQQILRYQGLKTTNYPWLIARALVGAINRLPWSGAPEDTWMCTSCSWKPYDQGNPNRYQFTFEFQYNEDTWNPTVVFKDERDGQPVTGASVADGSIKTVKKHREVDFESIIGVRVQGG